MGRRVAEAMMPEINKRARARRRAHHRDLPVPGAGVLLPRADHEPRRPQGQARAHARRLAERLHPGDRGQPVAIGFPEVYCALERGVVDCAVTGTATGNGARWYEVTQAPLHAAGAVGRCRLRRQSRLVEQARRAGARFPAEGHEGGEDEQWRLGLELTEDGVACNSGRREACKIGRLVENRPMTMTRATRSRHARRCAASLTSVVLPAWVKRCGERCGETYNRIVAPITGIRYEPR